jgi:hypothetical protein
MGNILKANSLVHLRIVKHHYRPVYVSESSIPLYIKLKSVTVSENPSKKYKAVFENLDETTKEVIYFGDAGVEDFTTHLDNEVKQSYIANNCPKYKQDWCKPLNEKSLERWILWNRPTLNGGIKFYKDRFALA